MPVTVTINQHSGRIIDSNNTLEKQIILLDGCYIADMYFYHNQASGDYDGVPVMAVHYHGNHE